MTSAPRADIPGTVFCAVVGASFAINTALASFSYRFGADALSVLTYRTLVAAIVLLVLLRLWRIPIVLPPGRRLQTLGLCIMMASYSYCLLGAAEHIPIALAVLTFYIYPLMVGLASAALGHERLTPGLILSLIAALIGLAFALDIGNSSLNPVGIALALVGAVLFTSVMLLNRTVVGTSDSRPVSFYMLVATFGIYAVIDLVRGEFHFPPAGDGRTAFLAVGLFYAFAIIGFFISTKRLGNTRAALVMNFEPVTSVFLGTVLLGDGMKPSQFAGAALVLSAIIFTAWKRTSSPAAPRS